MTSLAAFLMARIEEEQAVARAAIGRTEINDFGEVMNLERWADEDWIEISDRQLAHVNRHDPARVLADCEAGRRVVELHECEEFGSKRWCTVCAEWDDCDFDGPPRTDWPCPTLRALAQPYAGHAEFDPEWRL